MPRVSPQIRMNVLHRGKPPFETIVRENPPPPRMKPNITKSLPVFRAASKSLSPDLNNPTARPSTKTADVIKNGSANPCTSQIRPSRELNFGHQFGPSSSGCSITYLKGPQFCSYIAMACGIQRRKFSARVSDAGCVLIHSGGRCPPPKRPIRIHSSGASRGS